MDTPFDNPTIDHKHFQMHKKKPQDGHSLELNYSIHPSKHLKPMHVTQSGELFASSNSSSPTVTIPQRQSFHHACPPQNSLLPVLLLHVRQYIYEPFCCRYVQYKTSVSINQSSSLSSSSFLSAFFFFCFFDSWSFHRPLTCDLSKLGKMRSKISGEYHLAGTPLIPSLIFCTVLATKLFAFLRINLLRGVQANLRCCREGK